MDKIIKELKENLAKYKYLREDAKAFLETAKKEDVIFLDRLGKWGRLEYIDEFEDNERYRLRPNYKEEPEVEQINVRMIRKFGNGSPLAIQSINVDIMWYANKPYVSLNSLDFASRSIANAEEWFKELGVWGDAEAIKGLLKSLEPSCACENEQPKEPEVVKLAVFDDGEGCLCIRESDGDSSSLHTALNEPDFIGFEYASGKISPLPRLYSDETAAWFVHVQEDAKAYKVLTPTHVLFRSKT